MSINNFGQSVSVQAKQSDKPQPFGQHVSQQAHEKNEAKRAERAESTASMTPQQQAKTELNRSIVEAALQVKINAGNDSLALVFKAATEKINEILEPDLGPRALDNAVESGLDVSPEATADRIVSLTTGLFSRFQEANPELQGSELVDHFTDVIGGGILQGFGEAREILDGLGALTDDVAGNIDQTYDLVVEKLEQFRLDNGGSERSDTSADSNVTE
ncbi:DUF5610 domain-containing protein [Pontibacterium sp. N1Y112]|uniref:DUF5610 domain-containing protein n=1 Tax=Pontibacterium sinense TaxID=2781979 RepID=A0A8J7FVY5_9GAMM|nr:DUF5610 domain-containing protein [Pontibacterium sinense]MBE9398445.1 DUF5610 domain-containing protein [Pontibacterium sinense]